MATVPSYPRVTYMLGVSNVRKDGGLHTKFYYGQTLKEAMGAAAIKPGDSFTFTRFERGAVSFGEVVRKGVIRTQRMIAKAKK